MVRLFSRRGLRAAAACVAILSGQAAPAFAHAFLQNAIPPVGSTVATPPGAVICRFTEALEPHFSSLEVRNAAGQQVDSKDMHLAPGDATRMIVDLPKLGAGVYTVIWHATSVDTHKTEGRFSFTIAP
jgi:methionine-rich copper-binding protein CopC